MWKFEQQNAVVGLTTSQTAAFPNPVKAGSLIVLCIHASLTTTTFTGTPPSDTRGTTYTALTLKTLAGLGMAQIWWGITPSGGANTVTVTPSANDTVYLGILEYSGILRSKPQDQQGTASGSSVAPIATSLGAMVEVRELRVGFCYASGTATADAFEYTSRSTFNGDCMEDAPGDFIVGTVAAPFTMTPTGNWIALIATFRVDRELVVTPHLVYMRANR